MANDKPDCLTCGACCSPWRPQSTFCDLTEKDIRQLNPKFISRYVVSASVYDMVAFGAPECAIATKNVKLKSGPLKGSSVTVCAALRGVLGKKVSCSIYEQRPKVCRKTVMPGDKTCLQVRQMVQDLIDNTDEETG